MVAGPYTAGNADAAQRAVNLRTLNRAAAELFWRGHVPIIGVNMALPVIEATEDALAFERIIMPLSLALAERCDACLRVGGPSQGADAEMERFRALGRPVFSGLDRVPPAS